MSQSARPKSLGSSVATLAFALFLSLAVCSVFILIAGEKPLAVARIFLTGAFGTPYDLGLSLFHALPIALAGLAVALGLRSGLFNIGVEGQLIMGTFAAALTAQALSHQAWPVLFVVSSLSALAAGFAWGALLAWLKASRGAHEVVSGIMLNTLAYGLTSWCVLQFFANPHSQNPESLPIAEELRFALWPFFDGAPMSWHILLVPLIALLLWIWSNWTRSGFAMSLVGSAPGAARHAGFSLKSLEFWAISLGGLIAGSIGIVEVFGNNGRFVIGFSPGYGFLGIAVALLGRLHPFGILFASLVFGALYKGSLELDFETQGITKDFALILQAVIILFLSCESLIPKSWLNRFSRPTEGA